MAGTCSVASRRSSCSGRRWPAASFVTAFERRAPPNASTRWTRPALVNATSALPDGLESLSAPEPDALGRVRLDEDRAVAAEDLDPDIVRVPAVAREIDQPRGARAEAQEDGRVVVVAHLCDRAVGGRERPPLD